MGSRRPQRLHDGVLAALPEMRAGVAGLLDLFRQPDVRDDREAELNEVRRRVRKRAQLVETGPRRTAHPLVDQLSAQTAAARLGTDHQRTDLADSAAQGRQFGATDDPTLVDGDDEAIGVQRDLTELTRQQMALVPML